MTALGAGIAARMGRCCWRNFAGAVKGVQFQRSADGFDRRRLIPRKTADCVLPLIMGHRICGALGGDGQGEAVDGADGDGGSGGDGWGVGGEGGLPDFAADFYLADVG